MDYLILRTMSAVLAGAVMSQTGSLIQLSTRNILASPSTLGFDGLAVLWLLVFHSVMLMLGMEQPLLFQFLLGVSVFFVVGLVYSRFMGHFKNLDRLILMGLTFNLLVGAIFSLWQFLFLAFNLPFPVELWFGHFRFANYETVLALLVLEIFIIGGWFVLRREFSLFSLGHTISTNLKLKNRALFLFIFLAISIGTFTVVSLFGSFSFLGLVFPIVARKLWFKKLDLSGEFLAGSFVNGAFLMFVDYLCYQFPIFGAEIPVGLIATAVGALSLILLLWKSDLAKRQK